MNEVDKSLFENDSEITLFKTINLIWADPKWAIPRIKDLKHHIRYTGANIELVL